MTIAMTAPSDAGFIGDERRAAAPKTGIGRAWADYRAYRRTLGALASLTEKQLADIGMRRDALRDITRATVYRA